MKIKAREAVLLIVVLFLITGALYYNYFLSPTLEAMGTLGNEIADRTHQLELLKVKQLQLEENKKILEELIAEQDIANENMPTGISEPMQLIKVNQALRDLSQVITITFEPSIETFENYQKNTITLNFASKYYSVLEILDNFKALDYKNQVVNVYLEYTKDSIEYYIPKDPDNPEEQNDLQVNMLVEFFSFYPTGLEEPLEKQDFEQSPITGKSPFRPNSDDAE